MTTTISNEAKEAARKMSEHFDDPNCWQSDWWEQCIQEAIDKATDNLRKANLHSAEANKAWLDEFDRLKAFQPKTPAD